MKILLISLFIFSCINHNPQKNLSPLEILTSSNWKITKLEDLVKSKSEVVQKECDIGYFIEFRMDGYMIYRVNPKCNIKEHDHAGMYKITTKNNKFFIEIYRSTGITPTNLRSSFEVESIKDDLVILKSLKINQKKIGDKSNFYSIFIPIEGEYESRIFLEKTK